jgi:hypothetical protein
MAIAIDDNDSMALLRLFNEDKGRAFLASEGHIPQQTIDQLRLMGISGISNMLCCIKFAKYYELGENDVVATVLTDSSDMYQSRVAELRQEEGDYTDHRAAYDVGKSLAGQTTSNMLELGYNERKRIHNLKYYTWVEQQGKTSDELNALWYDQEHSFEGVQKQTAAVDRLIEEFNADVNLN